MEKARLILIEGLPGSGKSSAMRMVADILSGYGIRAEAWYEDSLDHPADFDGTAYLEADVYQALKGSSPDMEDLEPVTAPYLEGYLVSYRKALVERHLSPDSGTLQTLMRNDVYELEPDLHVRLLQERWRDFALDHQDDGKVFLFECSFIQNPVTALKVRHDAPDEMTAAHVRELLHIISPFDPVLLYLVQKDMRTSFLRAVDERPHAWYKGFEAYYTRQGYGLAHGLKGTEGVLRVLEERSRLEKSILSTLQIPFHLVDNSGFSPSTLRETLTEILTRRDILGIPTFDKTEKER